MSHILKLNKKENIEKAMKAKEVLKLLRITRVTLSSYVRKGIIEVINLPNGRYDYVE
jgi:putative resolvase